MEATTIATLVPSIHHLIKIGDPLQLRPHISSQALSSERDDKYRLDESLFERLMHKAPYSRLNIQRRAHPDMADLLRAGDYPYLIDHLKTHDHPNVPGLKNRMFWLDHDRIEDQPDLGSPLAKSFSNKYEVQFICEAVKYLVQHQGLSMSRITILTPYNGQVAMFVKSLKGFCQVLLNNEDKQSLLEQGMLSEREVNAKSDGANQVSLDTLIRVTTIDNYQGEENDIVFLSTVRSNSNNKCGFLGNQNRINVAVSRSRNGFYIVGNSALLAANVDGWRKVIEAFKEKNFIGKNLPLLPCAEHNLNTDIVVEIKTPQNFRKIPGCKEICDAALPCGHRCKNECHAEEMHTDGRLSCLEKCTKVLKCGHPCKKLCKDECGPCQHPLQDRIFECGHKAKVPCSVDPATVHCMTILRAWKDPKCGHIRFNRCSVGDVPCEEPCGRLRPCGHSCQSICSQCEHKDCEQLCGKVLECGHQCQSQCHYGTEGLCPPCQLPCEKSCPHGPCNTACSKLCTPCIKEGSVTHCSHQDPALLCCLPSSRLPCSERCHLPAPCGLHRCQGLCGEVCPDNCDACEARPEQESIFTLPCSCIFTVQELDERFEMSKLYIMDGTKVLKTHITGIPNKDILKCPTCSTPIQGSRRYALCSQIHELDDLLGSLLVTPGNRMWRLMRFVTNKQWDVHRAFNTTCQQIKGGPLTVNHNREIVAKQLQGLREALTEIERIRDGDIQLVQDVILAFTSFLGPSFETGYEDESSKTTTSLPLLGVPHLPYLLRCERIAIRCKFLIAKFLYDVYLFIKRQGATDDHLALFAAVVKAEAKAEISDVENQIDSLLVQCEAGNFRRLKVELIVQQTSIVTLLRLLGEETSVMSSKLGQALEISSQTRSARPLQNNAWQASQLIKQGIVATGLDDASDIPRMKSEAQILWKELGKFERGTLAKCPSGHYYCSKYFKYCPECE